VLVLSVISGIMPGEIYANDIENPTAALIMTSECNLLTGTATDDKFNASVRDLDELGFWDQLTPDSAEWEDAIPSVHKNPFVRKYARRSYILERSDFREPITAETQLPSGYVIEKAMPGDLREKSYENSDKLLDAIAQWGTDEII
jgi:hypothetical protein